MKRIKKSLMMACVAAALLASNSLMAQPAPGGGQGGGPGGPGGPGGGRGNFDPAQMRQRMAEMMKERLEVTNDDEWKILQDRIEKVTTLRQEAGGGGFGGMGGMGMMRQRNNNNDPAAGGNQPRRFGPEPTPEVAALQKALEGKASTEELKTKLASVREARKASAAKLEKAQEDLRKLVNVRQEAQLVLMGMLP